MAGVFSCRTAQVMDHRIDVFFELKNLAAHVDFDLFRQVTVGDGNRHVGDITHLSGQVAGHQVDVISEIFPSSGDTGDDGLTAELAFGADLTGDAGDLGGEGVQLIDHRIDGFFQLK